MNLYEVKGETEVIISENEFLIDGYDVGDRLLEGVMFEVKFQNDENGLPEIISVNVVEESKNYFEQLNQNKWLSAIKKYAEEILEYGDEVELSDKLKKKYGVKEAFLAEQIN